MFRHHHHHHHHPTTVVVTGRRRPVAPVAGAMLGTAAIVGTAACVGGAMARSSQRQQQANTCHTHVVTAAPTSSATPASSAPVYLYLKCTNGFYLTEDHKSVKGPSQIQSPASIWYEQHVGNGYYIYKSHHGRLLSVCDHGDVKLAQLKNPVKQKCMFYREQIGDHCRFRSVSGFFLCVDKSGHVTSTKSPQKNALFALQLVPAHSVPPPPSQAQASRDATPDSSTHRDAGSDSSSSPYQAAGSSSPSSFAPPPSQVNLSSPSSSEPSYQPYTAPGGYNSPTGSFTSSPATAMGYGAPPPAQGNYSSPFTPPPSQGMYGAPPPQGGYAPMPQNGDGYAPMPQYSSYTPYPAASGSYGYDGSRDMASPPSQPSQPANGSGSVPSYLMGLNASSTQGPY